jgi:hypothetical protein
MSTPVVHGVHPDAVSGWWLDHLVGEVAGCPMYAARRATVLRQGVPPEHATILLAPGDERARAALAALGGPTPTDALPLPVAGARMALVLAAHVVPRPEPSPEGRFVEAACRHPDAPVSRTPAPPEAGAPRWPSGRGPRTGRRAAIAGLPVIVLLVVVLAVACVGAIAGAPAVRARPDTAIARPDQIDWDTETATATVVQHGATQRFVLGAPGDQLLLGDWDGDRVPTPGLYRAGTGELWVFDRWAAEGQPAGARPLERRAALGTARVVRRDGRDTIVVDAPLG